MKFFAWMNIENLYPAICFIYDSGKITGHALSWDILYLSILYFHNNM